MKTSAFALGLLLYLAPAVPALAQPPIAPAGTAQASQPLLELSKQKWLWMAEKNLTELDRLFHADAVFVHMSRTMSKQEELEVIRTGNIEYRKADIQKASVKVIGDTAILLNTIRLTAVVRGNEVINPFVVTEVYIREGGSWKLGSMSFTRLVGA